MRHPRYVIKQTEPVLVIRDVGPWDEFPTVTNDIEGVIDELVAASVIPSTDKFIFFYYDSAKDLAGVLVHNGKFAGIFFPNPADRAQIHD